MPSTNAFRRPKRKKLTAVLTAILILVPAFVSTQNTQHRSDMLTRRKQRDKEMKKVFWLLTKQYENDKNDCKDDEFLQLSGSGACESCSKFCDLESDGTATCPERCKLHYMEEKLQAQMGEMSVMEAKINILQKMIQQMKTELGKKAESILTWTAIGILALLNLLAVLSVIMWLRGKAQALQEQKEEQKNCMDVLMRQNEETKVQLENFMKQQTERLIQQATPDTTPSTSKESTPNSTLERQTVSTIVEDMGPSNTDATPTTNIGYESEKGGK